MLNFTWLSDEDDAVLRSITARDWRSDALRLGEASDEDLAAKAVALGAVAGVGFGNIYAAFTHPSPLVSRYVNQAMNRPPEQPGSVTTLKHYIPELFDWSQLPAQLTRESVLELMDRLLEVGPFAFRGPAAAHLPEHLTAQRDSIRTVDLISAGYRCPSRRFVGRCLEQIEGRYLHVAVAQPAHYRLRGLQQELGNLAGVLMLAHRDERRTRHAYRRHAPTSPTLLAFDRVGFDRDGHAALQIEQHGSLHFDDVRPIAAELGIQVELGPGARDRVPAREYESEGIDQLVA